VHAWAWVGTAAAAEGGGGGLSGWDAALRVVGVLALLLFLAVWLRRWSGYGSGRLPGEEPALRVVAAIPLGPQRGVYVVLVGERGLVLGVTPHSIRLLTELTAEEVRQLDARGSGRARLRFLDVLRAEGRTFQGREGAGPQSEGEDEGRSG